MNNESTKAVAIIVAHPDDEVLWAGGTILSHPSWECFVVCLSRKNDADRAHKFQKAIQILGSRGIMGLMDDGPEQQPLPKEDTQLAILELLPAKHYDLVITHNPSGEYTRHLRHEEVGIAVNDLWQQGKITTNELWMFAYEDAGKKYFPRPVENADYHTILTKKIWLEKYSLITETYGFEKNSWEALTTPRAESFWQFRSLLDAQKRLHQFEIKRKQLNESPGII